MPQELLQISNPVHPESMPVVVQESAKSATQRHHRDTGWRLQSWHQTKQVANQNEQAEGDQEWSESLAVMADDIGALISHKSFYTFEHMLQRARFFYRELAAYQNEGQQEEAEDEDFHGDWVRDWRLRILRRRKVQRMQESGHRTGEQVVQKLGKPELFGHWKISCSG